MLIYNTTYIVENEQEQNFCIWLHEVLIPETSKADCGLQCPRLCRLLSHRDEGSTAYCLEWKVESTALLHRWHLSRGMHFANERKKIFGEKVLLVESLLEEIE